MFTKERKDEWSLILKGFIAAAIIVGILLQCEVGTSKFSLTSFRMFSIICNLAAAIFFIIYIAMSLSKSCTCKSKITGSSRLDISGENLSSSGLNISGENSGSSGLDVSDKRKKIVGYFKFLVTMSVILAGAVTYFILRKIPMEMDLMTKAGLAILHYIVPVAALADWFLFDEKGKTTWKMPLFAASFPLSYLAISLIAAQFMTGENRYPYHFINVDELGAGAVALNVVLVSAAFLAFGYLGVWIDHRLEKRIAQKNIEKE